MAGNAARGNQAVDPLIYEHSPLRFPRETSSPAIKYLDGRICTLVEERERERQPFRSGLYYVLSSCFCTKDFCPIELTSTGYRCKAD